VNREEYDGYLAAFNTRNYDRVCDFYAEPMDFYTTRAGKIIRVECAIAPVPTKT
jgi:hypothetical protein